MTSNTARSLAAVAAGTILAASASFGATVVIINNDPAGTGLNDPAPRAPIAGNPGTTLGQQRLNVLQRAAEIWARNLDSDVPITIRAQTASQFCDATSAVLASAGAATASRDFVNAPLAGTWYHGALANSIAGVDLDVPNPDVTTQFNINLDADPNCLGGNGWYYGYDHNEGAQTDLLAVMLHEYGHGLGFANFVNEATGTLANGFPDVYSTFTRDLEVGMDWNAMDNTQRIASAINDPDVVWTGPNATAAALLLMDPTSKAIINSPVSIQGEYDAQIAAFGPAPPEPGGTTGNVVLADDNDTSGTGGTATDGCQAFVNGGAIAGNIALVDRGVCNFSVKVANAQAVGAIGVLVANNQAGLPPMGGADPTITIPSYGITQALGNSIKAELGGGVDATLGYSATEQAGINGGFLRLNAPNPLQTGSSISHWSPAATPSLLMEPAITPALTDDVDLTLEQFRDIGWTLLVIFSDGFEGGDTSAWSATVP